MPGTSPLADSFKETASIPKQEAQEILYEMECAMHNGRYDAYMNAPNTQPAPELFK